MRVRAVGRVVALAVVSAGLSACFGVVSLGGPGDGGGTATVLASDTSPTATAVDDKSVYWSDIGGYIKSVPK